ncbi:hypothetical protein [Rugamonas fusca]|nr:hypothetical protein [Rugamonas fusca]
MTRWLKPWLIRLALAVVLALVFAAYLKPEFMLDMATRLYACF